MFHLCAKCYLRDECEQQVAVMPSVATVSKPEIRLGYQNHIVGLGMSWTAMVDYHINRISLFPGRFEDEQGNTVAAPSFLPILNQGADFWFRDQMENGKWSGVDALPRLRREATGKWILIGTVKYIDETIFPACHRS